MSEVLTDSDAWAECPHGLTMMSCSICRHPYQPPEPVTVEYYFDARYETTCRECAQPIYIGRRAAKMSDETYRHQECAT